MIQRMTVFYTSVLNINVLNFDETVVETPKVVNMLTIMDVPISLQGSVAKDVRTQLLKVPCSSGTLFGEIVLFLCHKVNNTVHKWVVLDIFPLAEKERFFFHFENKVVCQRLYLLSTLSRPLAHVRTQSTTLWVLEEEQVQNQRNRDLKIQQSTCSYMYRSVSICTHMHCLVLAHCFDYLLVLSITGICI